MRRVPTDIDPNSPVVCPEARTEPRSDQQTESSDPPPPAERRIPHDDPDADESIDERPLTRSSSSPLLFGAITRAARAALGLLLPQAPPQPQSSPPQSTPPCVPSDAPSSTHGRIARNGTAASHPRAPPPPSPIDPAELCATLERAREELRTELATGVAKHASVCAQAERASRALVIRALELDNRALELDTRAVSIALQERRTASGVASSAAAAIVTPAYGHPAAADKLELTKRATKLDAREAAVSGRDASLQARERAWSEANAACAIRTRNLVARERRAAATDAALRARSAALDARERHLRLTADEHDAALRAEREHFWSLQRALSGVVALELDELEREHAALRAAFKMRAKAAADALRTMHLAAAAARDAILDGATAPHLFAAANAIVLPAPPLAADLMAEAAAAVTPGANGGEAVVQREGTPSASKPPLPNKSPLRNWGAQHSATAAHVMSLSPSASVTGADGSSSLKRKQQDKERG